jgi:ankyrin repeat protein
MTNDAAKLIEAIRTNNAAAADALLAANHGLRALLTQPVVGDPFGATVLTHPSTCGHLEMVDVLIGHGADINARSDWWAGSFGVLDTCDPAVAPALIARGARVDIHAAARLGMLDALVHLLDGNAELVHARGGDGQTPLHFAANIDIAGELLKRGADIDAIDVDHESTPAQYMLRDRPDVAGYLVTRGCRTDILMAAALGALELARKHLAAAPDAIRTRVSPKWFPMRSPRAGGSIYIWTLAQNATPHSVARDKDHIDVYEYLMSQTPDELKLLRAAECGDATLVRQLLESGATFGSSVEGDDRRSIAIAASANNTDVVRLMLEAGWPSDVRGQNGGTPLHWAAWMGNAEMVRVLLDHQAALEDRGDNYHMTPLGWALHGSTNCWRKELGDYGATVRALLEAGAEQPDVFRDVDASEAAILALESFRTRQPPSAPPS